MLNAVGLLATIAVTVYITRLARQAIQSRTRIEQAAGDASAHRDLETASSPTKQPRGPWSTLILAALAVAAVSLSAWAYAQREAVRQSAENLLGLPPSVKSVETYQDKPEGPTFDHSTFDRLLRKHVNAAGGVDYESLAEDAAQLDQYLAELAEAPFDELGRDEKLALLINAYNAFTLQLILDHYPVESIQDIPEPKRWEQERWQIGPHKWSLNQIEHEQIRPKFREPRIHFALVCAAVGCPPLRTEAYTGDRIDEQLEEQTEYVHDSPRWFRSDNDRNVVHLTEIYKWFGGDFEQSAGSVLEFVARYSPGLRKALDAGRPPTIQWIDYDWTLNSQEQLQ